MIRIKRSVLITAAILFFLFICWIILAADQGQDFFVMKQVRRLPYGDKGGHFILYGILTLLVNLALNNRVVRIGKRSFLLGALLVGVFAVLEEFTQLALVSRNFELMDIACDLIGILVFSYLSLFFGKKLNRLKPGWKIQRR